MPRLIILDTGIVGMITNPKAKSDAVKNCQQWFQNLLSTKKDKIALPEIVDYEIRRELMRGNKTNALRRLNQLKSALIYLPLTTETMILASQFWAKARNMGSPTADNKALDGDVILAAQVQIQKNKLPTYEVIIATTNTKHLSLFVTARQWHEI
jgi:predicted nucleic acid-binding protein